MVRNPVVTRPVPTYGRRRNPVLPATGPRSVARGPTRTRRLLPERDRGAPASGRRGHMRLHGRVADEELLGDLRVREPPRNLFQDPPACEICFRREDGRAGARPRAQAPTDPFDDVSGDQRAEVTRPRRGRSGGGLGHRRNLDLLPPATISACSRPPWRTRTGRAPKPDLGGARSTRTVAPEPLGAAFPRRSAAAWPSSSESTSWTPAPNGPPRSASHPEPVEELPELVRGRPHHRDVPGRWVPRWSAAPACGRSLTPLRAACAGRGRRARPGARNPQWRPQISPSMDACRDFSTTTCKPPSPTCGSGCRVRV